MKTGYAFIVLTAVCLLSAGGCDFLRTVAGRPTSTELTEKRAALERRMAVEKEAEAARAAAEAAAAAAAKFSSDSAAALSVLSGEGVMLSGASTLPIRIRTALDAPFYIMLGAFSDASNASRLASAVTEAGYDAVKLAYSNGQVAVAAVHGGDVTGLPEIVGRLRKEKFCPADAWVLVNR